MRKKMAGNSGRLPAKLKPLFWDFEFNRLRWELDRLLIISRVLSAGNWDAITWLRSRLSDQELKEWFLLREGAELDPPRLRFWQLVLGLPPQKIHRWLKSKKGGVWEKRLNP